jgi:cysteinyl-tRNA synthetase
MTLHLTNTLTGKKEEFKPIQEGKVSMYNCGPTVYGVQHIGNLSMFVFTDILRRTLEHGGLEVKQVINFTDFGHLTGENLGTPDEGEDKMAKGLRNDGLEQTLENMKLLGKKYAEIFLSDIEKLNINTVGTTFPYASDYIPEQIELIKALEEKGFAYKTSDGIYFDTSKFPNYGELGGLNLKKDESQTRIGLNQEKINSEDFALWKFNEKIGWISPWGQGFPGWHIECSAMIIKILGPQIDIHTGGIEHVSIHHNNEIAQSEAATGKTPFSRYWLHRAHLQINDSKIAKSDGNVVYLSEIIEKGFSPIALRYLLLGSHYKTPTNFSWEALRGAQNGLENLLKQFHSLEEATAAPDEEYMSKFKAVIEDDLNTAEALALAWEVLKSDLNENMKRNTLLQFDKVLGLGLGNSFMEEKITYIDNLPADIQALISEREDARKNKDFKKSDEIREILKSKGYLVEDLQEGPRISKH